MVRRWGPWKSPDRSGSWRHAAWRDLEHLRTLLDLRERRRVGAGHPDLRAERLELAIERGAPARIEMGDDLVEQQQRRESGHLGEQPGMGEHETDQQRLLLAGRGIGGWDTLGGEKHRQ